MSLWAVVPVKALAEAKSRLNEVLNPQQREDLTRQMLAHTIEVLAEEQQVENTIVVSADPDVLTLARELGAQALGEWGTPSLNGALRQAVELAERSGVTSVLILPADIPMLQASDVRAVIDALQGPPAVVIAPDRKHKGTNALLLAPPGTLEFAFGPDSFDRHHRLAAESGAKIEIVDLPTLSLDLDTPADLDVYKDRIELIKE